MEATSHWFTVTAVGLPTDDVTFVPDPVYVAVVAAGTVTVVPQPPSLTVSERWLPLLTDTLELVQVVLPVNVPPVIAPMPGIEIVPLLTLTLMLAPE